MDVASGVKMPCWIEKAEPRGRKDEHQPGQRNDHVQRQPQGLIHQAAEALRVASGNRLGQRRQQNDPERHADQADGDLQGGEGAGVDVDALDP